VKCAIMQPTFNPWAGYFDMIDCVDSFVFLDDVQLARRSWQVRNRIRTAAGEQFISIPVQKSAHRDDLKIKDARIAGTEWRGKLLHTLQLAYRQAPAYNEVSGFVEQLVMYPSDLLADFNINIIESVCRVIGITTPLVRSSTLKGVSGSKDERLVSICKALRATDYLAAAGSAVYIEAQSPGGVFPAHDIGLVYQQYTPVPYPQLHGDFAGGLGVFDLLYNAGPGRALELIRAGRQAGQDYRDYRASHGMPA